MARKAAPVGGSPNLINEWVREIRTLTREWARSYTPKADLTPITEVKDIFYTHLLTKHPKVIEVAFTTPLFTTFCGASLACSGGGAGWSEIL